ncbi:MAG: preprotein translocase subunit YajC [Candidatus Saelkia tenebricola]|nr:preprotein translocase subunit YajC [Candidatus Saelkia tenebricola]
MKMIFAQIEPVAQPNPIAAFLPLILIFFIFYFLLIRPQHKKQKEHQNLLGELKKNDQIVTIGGIHGIIQDVKKDELVLKVDDEVKFLIDKTAVARIVK